MFAFDHQHYVPILQWKSGEQEALRCLAYEDKRRMTPLLNIPDQRSPRKKGARKPKRPKVKGDWLSEKAEAIRHSWGPNLPVFVELRRTSKSGFSALGIPQRTEHFFQEARRKGLTVVPVVRLGYNTRRRGAVARIVAEDRRGVCVRLTRSDLDCATLGRDLERLLTDLKLGAQDADLLLDLHILEADFSLMLLCAQVPQLDKWRTFTVAGGSFPSGVAACDLGTNWMPRYEWRSWSEQINGPLSRKPAFGDYATQHPVPFNPAIHPNPCANIRYATDRQWIVMKGKQLAPKDAKPNDKSRHDQFPAMARLLVENPATKEHCRPPSFSRGDEYLHKYADKCRNGTGSGKGNTGTSTTWLTAGVNHHLTFVVVQIANLFASSSAHEHDSVEGLEAQPPQVARKPLLVVVPPSPATRPGASTTS